MEPLSKTAANAPDTGTPLPLSARDGWDLACTLFSPPAGETARSVLIVLPAMGAHARPYRFMAAALARKGHLVITVDPRGHGRSLPHPKRGIDYSIDDIITNDVAAVVAHARSSYPELSVILLGHSLGGHISALYTAQNPQDITALITLTTTHVYYRKLGLPSISLILSFALLARLFGYLPGQYVGWGTPMAKTQVLDWVRWGLTDCYSGSDGRNLEPAMAALEKPLLSIGFTDDRRLARPAGIDHFNALLPACPLTRWTLSPKELDVPALGHFEHLRTGEKVWDRMDQWIRRIVEGHATATTETD